MSNYTIYNFCLALGVLAAVALVAPRPLSMHWFSKSARAALLLTVFAYPWDFFAISVGVWSYPQDPGFMVFGVPLNDLVFMWLCTFLSVNLLNWASPFGKRNSPREHASQ